MGDYLNIAFEEAHRCKTPGTLRAKSPVWKCDCGKVWVYGDLGGFKGILATAMWYPIEQWERSRGPVKHSNAIARAQKHDKFAIWVGLIFIAGVFLLIVSNVS